jgi:hypothetical protein
MSPSSDSRPISIGAFFRSSIPFTIDTYTLRPLIQTKERKKDRKLSLEATLIHPDKREKKKTKLPKRGKDHMGIRYKTHTALGSLKKPKKGNRITARVEAWENNFLNCPVQR